MRLLFGMLVMVIVVMQPLAAAVVVVVVITMVVVVVVYVIMTATTGARAVHIRRPRRDARALRRQTSRVRIRHPRPIIGPECAERRVARRRRVGRFWR